MKQGNRGQDDWEIIITLFQASATARAGFQGFLDDTETETEEYTGGRHVKLVTGVSAAKKTSQIAILGLFVGRGGHTAKDSLLPLPCWSVHFYPARQPYSLASALGNIAPHPPPWVEIINQYILARGVLKATITVTILSAIIYTDHGLLTYQHLFPDRINKPRLAVNRIILRYPLVEAPAVNNHRSGGREAKMFIPIYQISPRQ